jgi:hypothetical protein
MRLIYFLSFLIFSLFSCGYKTTQSKTSHGFTSFEVSSVKGYHNEFSFLVDSNKLYFSPEGIKLRYGKLPDTMYNFIDSSLFAIQNNTTIKTKGEYCNGCSAVSIKVVANGDTNLFTQKGEVSIEVEKLVTKLQEFVYQSEHNIINSVGFWQTESAIMPMPPSKVEDTKFKPSTVDKKSGS